MATVATTQRPRGGGTKPAPARKKAAPPPSLLDRLTAALASALGSHAGDVVGLLCIAVGIVAGMGVYASAAGPVGRGLDDGIGMVVGWGRVIVPVGLVALGIVLVRGVPDDEDTDPASQSYLWVGGLMIAIGGCGLLHLTNGRPGLDAPVDELVDAGGLLGVAAAAPLAAGIAPWGAGLILGALVLAGLVVLTRVPVRVAAESTRPPPARPASHSSTPPSASAGTSSPSAAVLTPAHGVQLFDQDADQLIDLDEPAAHLAAPSPAPASRRWSSPSRRRRWRPSSSRSSSAPR